MRVNVGSFIELNDTLQLTAKQGFPTELEINKHLEEPFRLDKFRNQVFTFSGKPAIRNYHQPPVRVFLVQNIDGKWIYWGLVFILSVTHDYLAKTTSGTFQLIYLYTPAEIKQAFKLIDQRPEFDYFA